MIPKFLYHITLKKNQKSIQSRGLLPKQPSDLREPIGVYLFHRFSDIEKQLQDRLRLLDKFSTKSQIILITIDGASLDEKKFITPIFGKISKWMLIYRNNIFPSSIISIQDMKLH